MDITDDLHQGSWAKGRDGEPNLGSLDFPFSQTRWSDGGTADREDDCEDDGAQCEDEGAQCDDEGWVEMDTSGCEDDPPGWMRWVFSP